MESRTLNKTYSKEKTEEMTLWGRRNKRQIIATILEMSKGEPQFKVHIQYAVGTSVSQNNEYLQHLCRLGLLEEQKEGRFKKYKTTEKGLKWLEKFKELLAIETP